jgi:CcmD family protein
MSSAEKYVAAAYLAVFVAVLVYLLIIGLKLSRLQREVAELLVLAQRRQARETEEVAGREAPSVG